eukprot:gene49143-23349_t
MDGSDPPGNARYSGDQSALDAPPVPDLSRPVSPRPPLSAMKRRKGPPKIATELQEAAEAAERAGGGYSNFVSVGGSLHTQSAVIACSDNVVRDDCAGDWRFVAAERRWEVAPPPPAAADPAAPAARPTPAERGADDAAVVLSALPEVGTLPCGDAATLLVAARVRAPPPAA